MIGIYCFSGTNNTYKCASFLKDEFIKNGKEAELNRIEDGTEVVEKDYELLVIAYPIHGFNMPTNVLQFCKNLKNNNTPVYFIKSSGEPLEANNNSSKKAIKILKKKGYNVCGDYHYIMPYNMIFRHTDEMASYMWYIAQKRIKHDTKDILNLKPHFLRTTFSSIVMGTICKIEHFGMRLNALFMRVNKKKCINCMACVKNCPMNNIKVVNGKFKIGTNCLGCTRCSFNCPKDAFTFGILNFMKVNGKYNFNKDIKEAKVGRYCRRAYTKYFNEGESLSD